MSEIMILLNFNFFLIFSGCQSSHSRRLTLHTCMAATPGAKLLCRRLIKKARLFYKKCLEIVNGLALSYSRHKTWLSFNPGLLRGTGNFPHHQ